MNESGPFGRAAAGDMTSSRPAAEHYAALDEADDQTSPAAVRQALRSWFRGSQPAGPILDIGTGRGSNLRDLSTATQIFGAEISLAAAREAKTLAPVVVADAAHLPFRPGVFGATVCTEVLEHVDDPGAAFAEMARLLRSDGVAFVTTPNYANLAGLHKFLADRRSGGHDWNPWGAHKGGYEGFVTARRLQRAAAPHLEVVEARALDWGQALTGRFRPLDWLAWTRPAKRPLVWLLYRLDRSRGWAAWHGMHVAFVLRRH